MLVPHLAIVPRFASIRSPQHAFSVMAFQTADVIAGYRSTSISTKQLAVLRKTITLTQQPALSRSLGSFQIGQHHCHSRSFSSSLFMASVDEDEAVDSTKTLESTWNIPGLKKEVDRLILRCHKKIGKASNRLTKAQAEVERLTGPGSENVSMEELEKCPNVDAIELECNELKSRLGKLNELNDLLHSMKGSKKSVLPENAGNLALELGVDDKPPARPQRGPGKAKGPKKMESFRLPYRRYYSNNNVEIRVGKQAEDNDELSLSPDHRAGSDWWMHASGCAGSHVVIRSDNPDEEVIQDSAALAARQSKCTGGVIKVSLCRCRNVSKPPGAKAGLVRISGDVRTIKVNMREAEDRLQRLDKTVLVN